MLNNVRAWRDPKKTYLNKDFKTIKVKNKEARHERKKEQQEGEGERKRKVRDEGKKERGEEVNLERFQVLI